jgi:hypothetical protein
MIGAKIRLVVGEAGEAVECKEEQVCTRERHDGQSLHET